MGQIMIASAAWQERLGLALTVLLEDPEGATVRRLAADAAAAAAALDSSVGTAASGSLWIAPAPVTVRLRLFCLPYAGGVSENVFARRVPPACCLKSHSKTRSKSAANAHMPYSALFIPLCRERLRLTPCM